MSSDLTYRQACADMDARLAQLNGSRDDDLDGLLVAAASLIAALAGRLADVRTEIRALKRERNT